jgi:hypothetical protein
MLALVVFKLRCAFSDIELVLIVCAILKLLFLISGAADNSALEGFAWAATAAREGPSATLAFGAFEGCLGCLRAPRLVALFAYRWAVRRT